MNNDQASPIHAGTAAPLGDVVVSDGTQQAIGLAIAKRREELGLTTTELAVRLGISQAQVSRLENGKQGFRSSTLARIANALGSDVVVRYKHIIIDEKKT